MMRVSHFSEKYIRCMEEGEHTMAKNKPVRAGAGLKPGEAAHYMNPGEARALLAPLDRSVLIALDGRMSQKEILERSGISSAALILSCNRLVALGLIQH
jgi:hypothetical protein